MRKKYSIRQLIAKAVCWVLLICFSNTVIDTPSALGIESGQSSPVLNNEMDSIYEWILESVADIENAIPEQDVPGTEESSFKLKADWDSRNDFPVIQVKRPFTTAILSSYTAVFFDLLFKVQTPPPDLSV